MLKSTFLTSFLLFVLIATGQSHANYLKLEGTVLGYTYDNTKIIFKKNKKVELEGSLSDVLIELDNRAKAKIETKKTDAGGAFEFLLKVGAKYILTYTKPGYGESAIEIDLLNIPEDIAKRGLILKNIELILNNYESDKPQDNGEPFGTIFFEQSSDQFNFKIHEFDAKKRLFKKNKDNTPINLMLNSLEKNEGLSIFEVDKKSKENSKSKNEKFINSEDDVAKNHFSNMADLVIDLEKIDQSNLDQFGQKIQHAKELLERDRETAVTELDYLKISAREKILESAERELENAKVFMLEQTHKIKAQQNFIYAIIGALILFLVLGIIVWLAYQNKKKMNHELAVKNKKITDSINYALKIQNSVLLTDLEIKKIVPNSCLYYKPLDAVSGDFYWFSKVNDKIIVAAVDCTGHGVPGAFMSLIGNNLLNQIVNEKGINSPAEILKELHFGVVKSLRQNEAADNAQDGMDISVCSIDMKKNKLIFSGAMNPVYLIQNQDIKPLRASLQTIGGIRYNKKERQFKEVEIDIKKGDRIYLFSDGFMDQFGGGAINEKFNIPRFKDLLLKLLAVPMEKQEVAFENNFEKWRGEYPQVDDVLVIGIEI